MDSQEKQNKTIDTPLSPPSPPAPPQTPPPFSHAQDLGMREKMYEEIRHKHEQEDQSARQSGYKMAFWAILALMFALGIGFLSQSNFGGSHEFGKPIPYTPTDQVNHGDDKEIAPRILTQTSEEKEARDAQQATHIQAMEDEIKSLTSIVETLQNKLGAREKEESKDRETIQASLGGIMALTRLESHMARGVPYATDLALLQRALADSPSLLAALSRLEPFAITGVETYDVLRNSFVEKAREQELLLQKAEATTWYSRLVLVLRGFISIRSVNDDSSEDLGRYAPVALALSHNDPAAVLASFDTLPEAARSPFAAWRSKLEARIEMRKALDLVAEKLIGAGAEALLKSSATSGAPSTAASTAISASTVSTTSAIPSVSGVSETAKTSSSIKAPSVPSSDKARSP